MKTTTITTTSTTSNNTPSSRHSIEIGNMLSKNLALFLWSTLIQQTFYKTFLAVNTE